MQNRRQFLTSLGRGSILGLMALFSGFMVNRWNEAGECGRNFTCCNCRLSGRCSLPEASNYRAEQIRTEKSKSGNGRERR